MTQRKRTTLGSFAPNARNPRAIDPAALEALARSMDAFGDLGGLVLNRRTGRFISGHQRAKHLPPAGAVVVTEEFAQVSPAGTVALGYVQHEGERWAVRIVEVDDETELAMMLAANKHGGTWEPVMLGRALRSVGEERRTLAGFTAADLEHLGAGDGAGSAPSRPPQYGDDVPPVPEAPHSVLGELYELGPHRLLCADAFGADALVPLLGEGWADLVVTDPPYAIYGSSSGLAPDVTDDKIVRPFFRDVLLLAKTWLREFGHAYVFCDWRSWASWWEMAKVAQLAVKNALIWDKGDAGLGNNYANTYEMVGFFANLPKVGTMQSGRRAGQRPVLKPNLLRGHPRVTGAERLHNAAKPVALLAELIGNSSEPGDVVLDPMLGSGSTLMACHLTSRRCVAVEIDPRWCDVTRQRYADLVGDARLSPTGTLSPKP